MKTHTTSLTPEELSNEVQKIKTENLSSYPSVFQMGRNFLKQGWLTAVAAAKGQPILTTPEKGAARLAICDTCDFFDKDKGRCMKCGCFMRAKAHIEVATCPAALWVGLEDRANAPASLTIPEGGTPLLERNVNVPFIDTGSIRVNYNIKDEIMKGLRGFSPTELEYFSRKYDEAAVSLDSTNKTFKIKNITFTVVGTPLPSVATGSIQ